MVSVTVGVGAGVWAGSRGVRDGGAGDSIDVYVSSQHMPGRI